MRECNDSQGSREMPLLDTLRGEEEECDEEAREGGVGEEEEEDQ